MALIPCPECNTEVSDRAGSCPRCGFPIKPPTVSNAIIWNDDTDTHILVNCPQCNKESSVLKSYAIKTSIGYSLKGTGTCSCGYSFDRIDKIGVNSQYYPSRRSTAGLLALILGGLGFHHFYLGRPVAGIMYLLFCWTFIPAILALVTAIQYFCMTDEIFNRTVDKTHPQFKGN